MSKLLPPENLKTPQFEPASVIIPVLTVTPLPSLQVQKLSTMVGEEKRDLSKEDVDMEDKRSTDHINQLMRQATSLQKVSFIICTLQYTWDHVCLFS